MKQETISAMLVAKVLWRKAFELSFSNEPIQSSTGLIILQDSVELFFLASLFEMGCNNMKDVGFEKIVSKLEELGIAIPELTKIKALNKERVIVKHYGQIGNPGTIHGYFIAAKESVNSVLKQVISKTIDEIVVADQLSDSEIRTHFIEAERNIENREFFQALISIRKGIYLAFEQDYNIEAFHNINIDNQDLLFHLFSGGYKAPYYARNKEWIEKNVNDPFGYIQIDYDKMKLDLLEMGIDTIDYENISRLTPKVIFLKCSKQWHFDASVEHLLNDNEEDTSKYCIETAIMMVLKKESFHKQRKYLSHAWTNKIFAKIPIGTNVFRKAIETSEVVFSTAEETLLHIDSVLIGLDFKNKWIKVHSTLDKCSPFISGYVLKDGIEIIKNETEETA